MTWPLTLRKWSRCRIGIVEAAFEEQNGEELIFRNLATGEPVVLTIPAFEAQYGEGRIARITSSSSVTPPFAEDDRRLRKAMGRQYVLRAWDARAGTSLSSRKLALFLASIDATLFEKGYVRVSVGQLRRDIVSRGERGDRPLELMFDAPRGRASRRSWVAGAEVVIAASVDFYYAKAQRTIDDAIGFFRVRLRETLGLAVDASIDEGKEPSGETIRRRIRGAASFENVARKFGLQTARARLVGVTEGITAEAPLDAAVLDATKVDTWLVVDDETRMPLGRPVITVIVDVCTRMILGIHVAFEGETMGGLMGCILDALRPKTWIQSTYPHLHRPHDGYGRMNCILWDNALRQVGVSARDALTGIGIDADTAPITTPEAKSIGERFWGTLNSMLFHKLPGGVPYKPDVMRLLDIDPEVKASIGLGKLRELIATVVDMYHHEVHDGIGMQPARAWREGIQKFGRTIVGDLAEAERVLGTYETGTVTREGVRFRGHRFHDPEATSTLLQSLVRHEPVTSQRRGIRSSGKAEVKFKYSALDAGKIHVFDARADPPRYVTLPNTSPRYARGLSFGHADMLRAFAQKENLSFVSDAERWAVRDSVRRMIEGDLPDLSVRDRQKVVPLLESYGDGPIVEAHGRPTTSGQGSYDVVAKLAEPDRTDGGFTPPQARRGGRKASEKSARSRKEGPKERPRTERFLRPATPQTTIEAIQEAFAPPVEADSPVPANGNSAGRTRMSTEELLKKHAWKSSHDRS
ncbi:hypothetical protein [Aureimonas phyllosphaerae]|uniref:Putative transposase n=1 Tax=Aureimonas phyllosphaerae TaxID=1166078 RepID=A0A7W6BSJ0_9HYPH|nr:hypothetical protein [Aureimonas phyllosphaerae]MBB3937238.1 putative transposase [Aureimonas phyllosphaerae]MBB3961125.1 putative transposase [Aureimonas phyllosphaerae]SFF49273.1 putative transposase [Aureimonas phyllosphaerae]